MGAKRNLAERLHGARYVYHDDKNRQLHVWYGDWVISIFSLVDGLYVEGYGVAEVLGQKPTTDACTLEMARAAIAERLKDD